MGDLWHRNKDLYLLVGGCVLTGVLICLDAGSLVRIVIGTLYLFYAPGYALLAALYPKKDAIGLAQRYSASVGLSVVISGLLGLMVAYTWGVSLEPVFWSLALWIALMVLVAGRRRRSLTATERFVPRFGTLSVQRKQGWPRRWESWARIAALVLLLCAAGRLWWVSSQAKPQFAEFYLLGPSGLAAGYPEHAVVGTPITVTVGAVHHGSPTAYELRCQIDQDDRGPATSIVLDDGERWESDLSIQPHKVPGRQKIILTLRKAGDESAYRELHLWLDVDTP